MYNRTQLVALNHEMFHTLLPAIVVLLLLMVVGTGGNSLVVYIFGRKLKSSTQNTLFMCLGLTDIVSCVVGIPSEVVDMSLYYLYEDATACKVLRFLLALPPVASANLLLVIAVDRYRRICKPLDPQLELKHARLSVGLSAVVAVVFAIPAFGLYGRRTVQTSVPGLSGCDCSVQDKFQGRLYPLLYEMMFGAAFVFYTTVLAVLYVRIWMETRRHAAYMASHSIPPLAMTSLLASQDDSSSAGAESPEGARRNTRAAESPEGARRNTRACSEGGRSVSRTVLPSDIVVKIRKSMRAKKLTIVSVTVTVVFVLSYLPHLCLILVRTVVEDFDHQLTGAGLVLYNIFLRSFFFNSVANIFIYSAMNTEFRFQCKLLCPALCKRRWSACKPCGKRSERTADGTSAAPDV